MSNDSEVDGWFAGLDHPLGELMAEVRRVILATDDRVAECIKWKSPTFTFNGNIASINPRAKKHISLMFHQGAKIPGDYPALEGGGDTARYMKFESSEDLAAKTDALKAVVNGWIEWKT